LSEHYDFVAIGGGTAGMTATRLLARRGQRVALVERDRPGGDCLWTGCIPTKALLQVAQLAHQARQAGAQGVRTGPIEVDFDAVRRYVKEAQARAGEVDTPDALRRDGVELLQGEARFVDPNTLEVAGRQVSASHLLIATGSTPVIPSIEGAGPESVDTNVDAVAWTSLPQSVAIIGGGPIGLEFGQALVRLGVEVSILEASDRILSREEPAASELIKNVLESEGARVLTGVTVGKIRAERDGHVVVFQVGGRESLIRSERVLVATGRKPEIEGLNLDAAGIRAGKRGIVVDSRLRTSQKHIFAAGDALGGPKFTHVAEAQGRFVAGVVAGRRFQKWNGRVIPRVTFTDPEVASVGLHEERVPRRYQGSLQVLNLPLTKVDRAITMDRTEGFLKVLVAPGWTRYVPRLRSLVGGEIVGATLVAPNAGDLLMPLVMAMRAHLPLGLVAWNMQAYPTMALGVRQVAGEPFER
jgi:pyruvate/2-oxoglutarate dehydrogenase complex dihydrolipoamide dehydrogenase (E3) component